MTMLATLEEVKTNRKVPSGDTSQDAALMAWIEAASWVIEEYTHRKFEKAERTEWFEGGLRSLAVKGYPIESVESVVVDGVEIDTAKCIVDSAKGIIHLKRGFGTREGAAGYEVEVTYTGGFDDGDYPAAAKQACLLLVDRFVDSAEEQGQLVQSEKLGDYSITYAKYSVGDDASGLGVFCPAAALFIKSLSGRAF